MSRILTSMAAAVALLAFASAARAATTGNIQGRVTDGATGAPMGGVTVTASGPQGEQTEFTDSSGRYLITDLQPGEYVVRFYFSDLKVERPGVLVQADKTLSVVVAMPTRAAKVQKYVIKESAPAVDVATSQIQTQVTDELVRSAPVAGRNYSSVLTLAPGAATDSVGFSFNGATGPENQFLIDGLNTTNPAFGLLGSALTLEFIGETEIITNGYNAEYGRATGGIVNVITKSGTNEFHGSVWGYYTPRSLEPPHIARPGEAIARIQYEAVVGGATQGLERAFDFGFSVGGPIIKNRLFFFAGFAPSYSTSSFVRIPRTRTAKDFDPTKQYTNDFYDGDVDTTITCPPWLKERNEALCAATTAAAYKTEEVDQRLWKRFQSNFSHYNIIGKLNLRLTDDQSLVVTYLGDPRNFDGVSGGRFNGNPYTGAIAFSQPQQTQDIVAHYAAKLFDRKLQIDVRVGWHYEESEVIPTATGLDLGSNVDTRSGAAGLSLQAFEDELEPCKKQKLGAMNNITFNPCPVTNYRDGGFGFRTHSVNQRAVLAASATYFLKAIGLHALKLGGDFEYNYFRDYRTFTGVGDAGGSFTTFDAGGAFVERQQFGQADPNDPNKVILFDGLDGRPLGFTAVTSTFNESIYLRDSWNLSFVPGLTVNLGLRWEAQQVKDVNGHTQIGIYDNWAPRIGFAYDVLSKGRAKFYGNYGRFYESIPLDINDRQFSGEGLVIQDLPPGDTNSCKTDQNGRVDLTTCKFPEASRANLNGGTFGFVSPKLQGQYSNEFVLGVQGSVGLDVVLGAAYIHRDLGRVIEDVSADGGRTYVIANPGEQADSGTVADMQGHIDNLNKQLMGTSDPNMQAALRKQVLDTSTQLALYNAAAGFERPKRNYDALVLTASKRLSHNFIVLASYTYSRTVGNYPGLFQASNGQLDPNISTQYDLPELLVNRNGPLPNDRPHNLKLTGAYLLPLRALGDVTLGVNFIAQSGTPIEVLGRHPTYGANETFILPRGSGGRTPTLTQLDLRIAWGRALGKGMRADVSIDIFNALNQQTPTSVDQQFTTDRVLPIPNGHYEDLKTLKTTSGGVPRLNPNYGQPTGYQAPLSVRLGARISF